MPTKKPESKKPEAQISYSKLKSGNWGVRSTREIKAGDTITVTKKDGDTRTETVERVVWQGDGVWIAALRGKDQQESQDPGDDDLPGDDEGSY